MNKLIFTWFTGGILIILLMMSCEKKVGKLPAATTPLPVSACDTITYVKHIKPIIDLKCSTTPACHVGPSPSGGVFLETYTQVKAQADNNRIKARVLDENPSIMPPAPNSPLTASEKNLLQCWLDNGKKEQ